LIIDVGRGDLYIVKLVMMGVRSGFSSI